MSEHEEDPIKRWLMKHEEQLREDFREFLILLPITLLIIAVMLLYWGRF